MIIVAGHLRVDAAGREAYLATCVAVGERWASREALDAFRGDGAGDEQGALLTGADVREFTAGDETRL
ncbi:hypothetical protein [Jiangella muralis]|uniref:hypothetical protein n=1 Tax=Jiangella muralis TaxID=702383 RepID=UPI00069F01D7|nr:hypothetical protein [Jiangella muralis]